MRILIACSFLASAPSLCPVARAAAVAAPSKITAVTVYTDRAVVTRTAPLELTTAGSAELMFEKLPAALVEHSLTVSGRGTAQVTLLEVTTRETHVAVTPNERLKAAEDELRGLGDQRRLLEDRAAVLKSQEASLERLEAAATAAPAKDTAPRLTIAESVQLLTFLEEQRTRQLGERQALGKRFAELDAQHKAAEKQLATLRGAGGKSYKTVVVRLDIAAPGDLQLAVSYALTGASWTPSYDARATSNDPAVELSYFGRVRQNTGEDWQDVALTLSTAQPSLGGAAPEVGAWILDVPQPSYAAAHTSTAVSSTPTVAASPVSGGWGSSGAVRLDPFIVHSSSSRVSRAAHGAPLRPGELSAAASQALAETVATSASFRIATVATVPSDNSPQKIPVATVRLSGVPEYLATPKRLAAAFLTAKVTNTSDFPLLPGAMNVFLDGTFVATTPLRAVMPGEKFDLALGADEGISVKHKRVQRFAEDTGLTNRGRRITYEYVVTIQNNKKSSARVVVADHVPMSRYERIVVKVLTPSEKEQKPGVDGALKWTLDLKPGEKRELPLKFSIEFPNDLPVTGVEA